MDYAKGQRIVSTVDGKTGAVGLDLTGSLSVMWDDETTGLIDKMFVEPETPAAIDRYRSAWDERVRRKRQWDQGRLKS